MKKLFLVSSCTAIVAPAS